MLKAILLFGAVVFGPVLHAEVPSCEADLTKVNPAAEDPYERLGLKIDNTFTEASARWWFAVRGADSHRSRRRLAEAFAQIKLNNASGRRLDKSPLPVGALRRAHGEIFGDPMSGRFTFGYGLNKSLQPTMNAELLIRDVLHDEKYLDALRGMPVALREPFQEHVNLFATEIRRVGVEGGFEDVIATNKYRRETDRQVLRLYWRALRVFVDVFGATYLAALTDPKGDAIAAVRETLRDIRLPKAGPKKSLHEQLVNERDPRTFLRKIIFHLRRPKRQDPADFLMRMGELYQSTFLVEQGQFLQHLLFFATDEWTGHKLDPADAVDRLVLAEIFGALHYIWVEIPRLRGHEPRFYDYVGVLWDAHRFFCEKFSIDPGVAQPESPLWLALQELAASNPDVIERVRADRLPPVLPSDIFPW